jgi:hypothetical protein
MTGKDLLVSPAVAAFLAARSPGWQHRVRVGACANAASREYYGRGPLPPPPPKWVSLRCEVCGGEMRYRRSEIEGRQRRGMPLPRFCSRRCAMLARHRPAAEA